MVDLDVERPIDITAAGLRRQADGGDDPEHRDSYAPITHGRHPSRTRVPRGVGSRYGATVGGLLAASFVLALAVGAEPGDLDDVQPTPEEKAESEHRLLEAVIATPRPANPAAKVVLSPGEALFAARDVTVTRAPRANVRARLDRTRSPPGTAWVPWVEVVPPPPPKPASPLAAEAPPPPSPPPRPSVHVLYVLRALRGVAPVANGRATATLEILDEAGVLARVEIAQPIQTLAQPAAATPELADDLRKAAIHFEDAMQRAYEGLEKLRDDIGPGRLELPPEAHVKSADRPRLDLYLHAVVRTEIARERLRALADVADESVAARAILALGALPTRAGAARAAADAVDAELIIVALENTRIALEDLRLDEAEARLTRLRNRGRMNRGELTRALVLAGAVAAARGKTSAAREHFEQALCVAPGHQERFRRAFYRRAFDAARGDPERCSKPIQVGIVTAARGTTPAGPELVVRAPVGPDPFGLITGGDIELWGPGGALASTQHVRVQGEGKSVLEAHFADTGGLENYANQILVKVFARDVTGVPIAIKGDPDPLALELATPPGSPSPVDLPWWVWAIAGGIVAVGAATAGIIVLSNRGVTRGIGPINADF